MILETLGHLAAYALFVGACIGLALLPVLAFRRRDKRGPGWTDADFDAITAMRHDIDLASAAETAALEGTEALFSAYHQHVGECMASGDPAPQMDEFLAMELDCMRHEADDLAEVPDEIEAEYWARFGRLA